MSGADLHNSACRRAAAQMEKKKKKRDSFFSPSLRAHFTGGPIVEEGSGALEVAFESERINWGCQLLGPILCGSKSNKKGFDTMCVCQCHKLCLCSTVKAF